MFHAITKTRPFETPLWSDVSYTEPFYHFRNLLRPVPNKFLLEVKRADVPGLLWAPQMCCRSVYATSCSLLGQRISRVRGRIFQACRGRRGIVRVYSRKYLRWTDVCTEPVHTASDVCLHCTDPSTSLCAQIHFRLSWSDWSQLLGSGWLSRADLIFLFK